MELAGWSQPICKGMGVVQRRWAICSISGRQYQVPSRKNHLRGKLSFACILIPIEYVFRLSDEEEIKCGRRNNCVFKQKNERVHFSILCALRFRFCTVEHHYILIKTRKGLYFDNIPSLRIKLFACFKCSTVLHRTAR